MPFDPDAFLAGSAAPQQQSSAFDPDAFLKGDEPQPKPAPTWSEVPGQALRNAPHSAWEFAKNVAAPVADVGEYGARGIDWLAQKVGAEPRAPQPTPTLTGMSEIGQGVMQKLGMMKGEEHIGKADAVGKFLMDRYGSVEGIKKTMAEDPVGLAADVSTVLSGGAMLAGRVPSVGGVLSKAARVTDPLTLVGKATSPILSLGSEALGLTTGAGGEAVRLAGRAGLEGGEAASSFERNLRGRAPMEEAVVESRQAASALRNKRNAAYNKEMADITASTPQGHKLLQLDDIDKALTDTADIGKYKGRVVDPEAAAAHQKLSGIVDEWRKDPIHTIEDIDKLKQTMGGILKDADANSREKLVAGKIYDAAKQTIVKADPRYAKAMEGYSKSTELLDELDRTLSLKDTATVDTTLRKLQSVLRDNVNTSYGRRKELAQFIVDNGAPNLLHKLAGQSLKSAAPRGLARLSTAIGAEIAAALGLAMSHTPAIGAALAAAPLMSPRVVGEAAYGAGKIVGGARPLMKPSYLTGRLVTDPAGFKKGGRVTKTFRYQEGGAASDSGGTPPPENQAVKGFIAQQQAAFQPNYAGETWEGSAYDYARAAMQPGMSGYFDVSNGSIVPHQFTAREVAAQGGEPLGQLAGSLLPQGNSFSADGLNYNIPNDDRGGFFNIGQLYQGAGRDVPSIMGATMGQGLSTNNWRLLGRGPGWIMRNGFMIDTRSPLAKIGFGLMGNPGGNAAENMSGAIPRRISLGTGFRYGVPGIDENTGQAGWPGAEQWIQGQNPSEWEARGGRIQKRADGGPVSGYSALGQPINAAGQPVNVPSAPEAPPPVDPGVQARIDSLWQQRNQWAADNPQDPGYSFGTEEPAMQAGMGGYFQIGQGGYLEPKVFSPSQVAAQAGETTGQLAASFGPSGGRDEVRYNILNDRGGFFDANADSLPTIGQGLSTNNWRLLGRGPGYIMRQGNIINTRDPATMSGLPLGYNTSFSDTAESGAPGLRRYVAPGAALTGHSIFGRPYWPGTEVFPSFNFAYMSKRGGRIKGLPSIRR